MAEFGMPPVPCAACFGRLSAMRRNYADSCAHLQSSGLLDPGDIPPMPDRLPHYDDPEPLGVNFFQSRITGDLARLTLPRTFFDHSEVCEASFRESDLSESNLCWCDFIDVDFSQASLRGSDLRASGFERVRFTACDLSAADLRQSSFQACDFSGCTLRGAKLTREQAEELGLSEKQLAEVDWQADDGPEPGGG